MFQNHCLFLVLSSSPWKADHGFSGKVGLADLCTAILGRKGNDYFLFLNFFFFKASAGVNISALCSGQARNPATDLESGLGCIFQTDKAFCSEFWTYFPTRRFLKEKMLPGSHSRMRNVDSPKIWKTPTWNSLGYFGHATYIHICCTLTFPLVKKRPVGIHLPSLFLPHFAKLNKMIPCKWKCFELPGGKSRAVAKSVAVYQNFPCQKVRHSHDSQGMIWTVLMLRKQIHWGEKNTHQSIVRWDDWQLFLLFMLKFDFPNMSSLCPKLIDGSVTGLR